MPLPPQKFREMVFQILYSSDLGGEEGEATALMLMGELKVAKRFALQAHERSERIAEKRGEIDEKIRSTSTEYNLERISRVERALLRLGLYELLYDPSVPAKVVIAEAIRLTRKFGTPESAHFVNAILDAVYREGSKNCFNDKETAQIFCPGANGIAQEPDVSEDKKFAAKTT